MNMLLDALGGLGDTLAMPGDYVRGVLGGSPGERLGGRDLLRRYGLAGEEDNWGNFAAGMGVDVATDPLTYLMAYGGGALGGKLASKIPGSVAGTARVGATMDDLATSPALKALGGNITRFENVVPGSMDDASKYLANAGKRGADPEFVEKALGNVEAAIGSGARGVYFPGLDAMGTAEGASLGTGRHEFMHGLVDQAAKGAQVGELPYSAQPAGYLRKALYDSAGDAGDVTRMRGELPAWATLADEFAAHTAAGTTPLEKLQGAAGFLFNPEKQAAYGARLGERGLPGQTPWAARAYGAAGALPRVGGAGLGGMIPGALRSNFGN
jgi:hypothetical protein